MVLLHKSLYRHSYRDFFSSEHGIDNQQLPNYSWQFSLINSSNFLSVQRNSLKRYLSQTHVYVAFLFQFHHLNPKLPIQIIFQFVSISGQNFLTDEGSQLESSLPGVPCRLSVAKEAQG